MMVAEKREYPWVGLQKIMYSQAEHNCTLQDFCACIQEIEGSANMYFSRPLRLRP